MGVYGADVLNRPVEGRETNLAAEETGHFAGFACEQGFHRSNTKAAGQHPVHTGGAATPLDMAQY